MNDDVDDDDDCSGNNNEDDEVQVIKPSKTSVNAAIDTRMTYTMLDGGKICRLTSRIGALLESGWSTGARVKSISRAALFTCNFCFVYIH